MMEKKLKKAKKRRDKIMKKIRKEQSINNASFRDSMIEGQLIVWNFIEKIKNYFQKNIDKK